MRLASAPRIPAAVTALKPALKTVLITALIAVPGLAGPVAAQADPPPALTITPDSGPAGTEVTLTSALTCPADDGPGASPSGGPYGIAWLGGPIDDTARKTADDGLSTTAVIPQATPGEYEIWAQCLYSGARTATATYTVEEPQAPSILQASLQPASARPGRTVALTVTGLFCEGAPGGAYQLSWGDAHESEPLNASQSDFTADVTVPDDLPLGPLTVTLSCYEDVTVNDDMPFEVLPAATAGPRRPPRRTTPPPSAPAETPTGDTGDTAALVDPGDSAGSEEGLTVTLTGLTPLLGLAALGALAVLLAKRRSPSRQRPSGGLRYVLHPDPGRQTVRERRR
ncbi:hypothetical protein [Thermoactinospora rubra]|uniref:hypothetical protein n=1 Tax=Thermoactinospora rubra TaxID=1088767 RepID=UPI000A10E46D|nr:hypothetical protein [Thermoactinospora rubra]